jgi:tetratricopeptide (TPR) repeat protein
MRNVVACSFVLLFALTPLTAQSNRDWQDLYREAIAHVAKRDWKPAEDKLLAAKKAGPPSGRGQIKRTFGRDSDYFPEFYLGVVYLNTGRFADAQVQFQIARTRKIDIGEREFQQLPDFEARANEFAEAEAKKRAVIEPKQRYRGFMDQAQKFLAEGRYDDAETAARQARGLNVENGPADDLLRNITRSRANARVQALLKGSPSLQELRRMLSEYEGTGASLDEVRRRIDAMETVERRATAERAGMIAYFNGSYTQAISALAEAEKAGALTPRGHFYRALTLASLATRGKVTNDNQLREARKAWAIAMQRADEFKVDLRYVSPQLLDALRGQ